ncbi:LRR receptor-like serine threonine-protein kinase [Seminavis robusta]|uniref:LRR receptor-like serine threonine-protein kinase n=1 Tax=Seminavis robusta TaxID=568900 RepID=A0A9N8HQ11_9STRA|nr:LRR receptor-like serine threonine-protein kinase [Seminavis robusta]|eukprot:Sro1147_g246400.1 LRR receptor-like serine threonine-protein kinase (762) ;mRNA; f:26837-29122
MKTDETFDASAPTSDASQGAGDVGIENEDFLHLDADKKEATELVESTTNPPENMPAREEDEPTRDRKLGGLYTYSTTTTTAKETHVASGKLGGVFEMVEPPRYDTRPTTTRSTTPKLGAVYVVGGNSSAHSVDAAGIEELPIAAGSSHAQQPLPGAYPQRGIDRQFSSDAMSFSMFTVYNNEIDVDEFILDTMLDVNNNNNNNNNNSQQDPRETHPDGLAVAQPISALSLDLAQAEPVDVEALQEEQEKRENRQEQRTKQNKKQMCTLGIGVLILVAIVIVVIVLVGPGNSAAANTEVERTSNNATTESSTTTAPSVPELPMIALLPNSTQDTIRSSIEMNDTTPQLQAYQWMLHDPMLANYSDARRLQRFALATLYYATGGDNWKLQGVQGGGNSTIELFQPGRPPRPGVPPAAETTPAANGGPGAPPSGGSGGPPPGDQGGPPPGGPGGPLPNGPPKPIIIYSEKWLSYDTNECDWFNVLKVGPDKDAICDEEGNLLGLDLMRNNLVGILPQELGLLSKLHTLQLRHNQMEGNLLPIFNLKSLMRVHVNENEFTGTLPTEIATLSSTLLHFSILENNIHGTIPSELLQLSKLTLLKLSRNRLTGTIPSDICQFMPNLEEFRLERNNFQGLLPPSLSVCTNLKFLEVTDNQLTGSVPARLGDLTNLYKLVLAENQFVGNIPSELGMLRQVEFLWFYNNPQLTGTIPLELESLNTTLWELRLKGTSLTGTIPSGLCAVPRLEFDCAPGTRLCGCDCPCHPL